MDLITNNDEATILYDNIDNRSVTSSIGSKKNAELIAAAFGCSNNAKHIDVHSSDENSSTELNKTDLINQEDLITIATTDDEKLKNSQIEKKKKLSEKQESHYLKLKKLRENEKKKKELIRLERIKKLEVARSKRKKRIDSKENESDGSSIAQKDLKKTKKHLNKIKKQDVATKTLNKQIKKLKKPILKKPISQIDDNLQKRKKKINKSRFLIEKIKSKEFIEDEEDSSQDSIEIKPIVSVVDEAINDSTLLNRVCLVCKMKIHQDLLSDHCGEHYYDSAKCFQCDKVSSNPSNYVTHILSHLESQFYCIKCLKWFRQPIVFRRHQRECTATVVASIGSANSDEPIKKRKKDLKKQQPTIDNNRTRLARTASAIALAQFKPEEPIIKKRLGRPPKYPKQEPKQDDEEKEKSIKPKLNGTKKSSEKKLNRLSSVSSGTSSAHSSNEKPLKKKQLETVDFEDDVDDLMNQSDDLEDIDELDDIIVSDYELNDEPIIKQEMLKPINTNLILTATYKVKIQLRGTSNNNVNNKQKENIELKNDPTTPQKLSNLFVLNTPSATPSKTNQNNVNQNELEANQLSNVTTYFECPECDKKFVSHYGLFQHYDQHPALAVTCPMCSITFENHHVLILHYKNAHNIQSKDKEEDPKQKTKTKHKNKSKPIDEVVPSQDISNDLSALPSIMTRTSRLTNLTQNHKPSLITAAALLNHSLKYKTSGFADLSFIDFSCVNFPRIAQNFCELWPRKLQSSDSNSQQPLHNYMCNKCGFYFPCKASLVLHKMNKFSSFNNHLLDDNKAKSNCQLFMTNSKYLCYEKCLDEIITKIEQEQQQEQTSDFLKSFDLVPVQTLPKLTELNNTEKLMLKMRQQMLDINQQFIIDLDKWKLINLNEQISEQNDDFLSKINLKPHVNLNRPLLIRSKKIKRSQKTTNGRISPQKQQNNFKSIPNPISTSDSSLNSDSAKFSKPFFSATSGNFSAAAAVNTKPTMNSMLVAAKKRKIIEKKTKLEKKLKQKEEESLDEIDDESNSSDEILSEEEDMKPNPPQLVQRRIASDIPPSSKALIIPTPLYKASSANSSILASASGMNNHLMQSKTSSNVSMPKLQPVSSVRNLSSNYTMPKLKPYNSYQANKRPSLPPPPPLTLMSGFNSRESNNNKKQKVDEVKMPQLTKSNINQVTNTSTLATKSVKSSENICLKCKFCFEVFKGQSEFFQHVIVSHPKMLEQRLNRPAGKSNTSSSRSNSKDAVFKQPTTSITATASANSSSYFK